MYRNTKFQKYVHLFDLAILLDYLTVSAIYSTLVKSLTSSNLIQKQYKTDEFPNDNVFFVSFSFSIESRQLGCQDSHYCESIKGKLGKCWSWSKASR